MERRNFVGRPAKDGKSKSNSSGVLHSIHIPGAKHYRIKKNGQVYIFSGISPKQFKALPNAKVVGRFSNQGASGPVVGGSRQFEIQKQIGGVSSKLSFNTYNTPRRFFSPKAYVPIGDEEYLIYESFSPLWLMAPAAAVAAIVVGALSFAGDRPINPLGIAPTVAIGGDGSDTKGEMEMIDFAGYDSVLVTADDPYVLLQNPETNDVYFSYVLSDDAGKEFKTTDLIPPGKALQWDARSDLGSGEHVVNMHVDTYDMEDTSIPYNAMNYDKVKVVVK